MLEDLEWNCFLERPSHFEISLRPIRKMLETKRTCFQHVGILDLHLFGKTLILDGDIQSAEKDEFIYHETLVHPAMLMPEKPEDVLVLGGGEGATLREVYRHRGVKSAVMVDIDEELVRMCQELLPEWSSGAFEDPRTELVFSDAREWLQKSERRFDLIIHDLTDLKADSPAKMLFSREFFELLKSRLKPGGIMAMQASRMDVNFFHVHRAIYHTLRSVFTHVRPFQTFMPCFYNEWGFMTASGVHDPAALTPEEVDRSIAGRIEGQLRFYDGLTHRRIFSLPLTTRRLFEESGKTITEDFFETGG